MARNILREVLEESLKDVHLETGRVDDFKKVVNGLEIALSTVIVKHDVDYYTEVDKDFSGYEIFK